MSSPGPDISAILAQSKAWEEEQRQIDEVRRTKATELRALLDQAEEAELAKLDEIRKARAVFGDPVREVVGQVAERSPRAASVARPRRARSVRDARPTRELSNLSQVIASVLTKEGSLRFAKLYSLVARRRKETSQGTLHSALARLRDGGVIECTGERPHVVYQLRKANGTPAPARPTKRGEDTTLSRNEQVRTLLHERGPTAVADIAKAVLGDDDPESRHKIRGCIHALQKAQKIEQVARGVWRASNAAPKEARSR